jgi:hypothetical protein
LALLLLCFPSIALADRVAVLRPRSGDPAILSAFAHLQGELALHDFEVVVVDAAGDQNVPDDLAITTQREGAMASVSLLRSNDGARAEIWIGADAGATGPHAIEALPGTEGPHVLAVRVVALLNASLREWAREPERPSDAAPVADRVSARVESAEDRSGPSVRAAAEAAVVAQWNPAGFRAAWGPSMAIGLDASRMVALRLVVQFPMWGAQHETQGASATITEQQAIVETRLRVRASRVASIALLVGAGVHRLSVQGHAEAPYEPNQDAAWSGVGELGIGGEWLLGPAASLTLRARSLMLGPRPVIEVGAERVSFGRPLFQATGGLDVAF